MTEQYRRRSFAPVPDGYNSRTADDHGLASPWLRVNVLLRDVAHLLGDRDARPVLKVELNNAIRDPRQAAPRRLVELTRM